MMSNYLCRPPKSWHLFAKGWTAHRWLPFAKSNRGNLLFRVWTVLFIKFRYHVAVYTLARRGGALMTGQGNIRILWALPRPVYLAIHCDRCRCMPDFKNVIILGKFREQKAREIHEAFWIRKMGNQCISSPSLLLTKKEAPFLEKRWR